ncbi:uncharacterized protein LOC112588302 [Harpegnathos saltator]|uniref:uncharacterized protein LOC112588302 n=1 Tax=Harpegnathos saltator TaxID=610380 RepID=UPI000DBEEDF1|nr:uncharacterized protein LOC112588302 [Harpegnathos saltator]
MGILDEVGEVVRQCHPQPVVVAGDFNAHSTVWGCGPRQGDLQRGNAVISWAAALGLLLMNRGSTSTCVRPNGESVIDLTWASPSAARIFREWAVVTEGDNMSDHRYIVCALGPQAPPQSHRRRRRATYWWTAAIADLREAAAQAKRVYNRARLKEGEAAKEKEGCRQARNALKAAIAEAMAPRRESGSNWQYGFRPGRSTLDAIQQVRDLARAVMEERGRVLLAVSLDITNAFNTLPWPEIG